MCPAICFAQHLINAIQRLCHQHFSVTCYLITYSGSIHRQDDYIGRRTWWRFCAVGSNVGQINEVTLRRAWLVLGWVTVSGSTPGAGNLSQSNQPPRSTQPGHPSVGRHNEYRPKGGDALRLEVKADMVLFAGNTV